jgi:cephalosporin-C deacetylase
VLWSTGLMDTVCPPSSQFAAYNKIRSKKLMDIHTDFVHEDIPGAKDRIFDILTGMECPAPFENDFPLATYWFCN